MSTTLLLSQQYIKYFLRPNFVIFNLPKLFAYDFVINAKKNIISNYYCRDKKWFIVNGNSKAMIFISRRRNQTCKNHKSKYLVIFDGQKKYTHYTLETTIKNGNDKYLLNVKHEM